MQTVLYALKIETCDIFKGTEKCMWNKTSSALVKRLVFLCRSAHSYNRRRLSFCGDLKTTLYFGIKIKSYAARRGNQLLASHKRKCGFARMCGSVGTELLELYYTHIQLQSPSEITVNFLSACWFMRRGGTWSISFFTARTRKVVLDDFWMESSLWWRHLSCVHAARDLCEIYASCRRIRYILVGSPHRH